MTTDISLTNRPMVPDAVGRRVVSARSYAEWSQIHDDFAWLRSNMPVGQAVVKGYDRTYWTADDRCIIPDKTFD